MHACWRSRSNSAWRSSALTNCALAAPLGRSRMSDRYQPHSHTGFLSRSLEHMNEVYTVFVQLKCRSDEMDGVEKTRQLGGQRPNLILLDNSMPTAQTSQIDYTNHILTLSSKLSQEAPWRRLFEHACTSGLSFTDRQSSDQQGNM